MKEDGHNDIIPDIDPTVNSFKRMEGKALKTLADAKNDLTYIARDWTTDMRASDFQKLMNSQISDALGLTGPEVSDMVRRLNSEERPV